VVQAVEPDHLELRGEVQRHYDSLVAAYALLWGEHIHHGYWDEGAMPSPPYEAKAHAAAQERLITELVRFAGIRSGSRVADIGCGIGGSSRWLAQHAGCRTVGVSISGRQLQEARRRGPGGAAWIQADAATLPLRSASCDAAWIVECSEHLLDRPSFLRECARVVRPGGTLALAAWLRTPEAPTNLDLLRRVESGFLIGPLLTADEYLSAMARAGWSDVAWRDVTRAVLPTWDICIAQTERLWVRSILPWLPEPVRRFVGAFRDIRRAYREGAMGYGLFRGVRC
jgi:tocopherol O-methyltransferase